MRRLIALLASSTAASVLAAALPASAASATSGPPAPTVTVETAVAGEALPASPMQGSWRIDQPGRAATLTVSGAVTSPAVTTVRSTWISSWRWTRPQSIAFDAGFGTDYTDVAVGSTDNVITLLIEIRRHGHPWQMVGSMRGSHDSQFLLQAGEFAGMGLGFFDRVRLQWRVRMTAKFYDTSKETLTETVKLG